MAVRPTMINIADAIWSRVVTRYGKVLRCLSDGSLALPADFVNYSGVPSRDASPD